MRIDERTRQSIVEEKDRIFGCESQIYLFGSRVDDSAKGGDIDLFLVPYDYSAALENRFTFLASLESKIGIQRIDLVIASDSTRLIEQEAISKGIKL